MSDVAPTVWPVGERHIYCYNGGPCNPKNGNPFGPFWDHIGVDFVGERKGPYPFDSRAEWARLPAEDHPVIAFKGAPARFPAAEHERELARFVRWSASMNNTANE